MYFSSLLQCQLGEGEREGKLGKEKKDEKQAEKKEPKGGGQGGEGQVGEGQGKVDVLQKSSRQSSKMQQN